MAVFAAGMGIVLAAGFVVPQSLAGNESAAAMTGLTSTDESTVGRRLLMHSIGANNDIVHDILDGALPMDNLQLRGRLSSISAMLYAFPSLYRAEPNPYSEEAEAADAARVSLSSIAVWDDFETFKSLSYEAYFKAQEAADATNPEHMLELVEELEVMCESCHETYRKEFTYVDFDNIEDMVK